MVNMKALVTGADGFIGSHLVDALLAKGIDVCATVYDGKSKNLEHVKGNIKIVKLDINSRKSAEKIISNEKPDYIFHLAAQAYVMPSWRDIESTMKTNIFGTMYLLDAVKKAKINPVIVVACSSAEYGLTKKEEIPIKETREFRPSSPYAVSKVGTDMMCYLYWRAYNQKIIRVRLFNTGGPRKKGSAIADFAQMITEVEKGLRKKVEVGNLEGVIDFTDGRDSVQALILLAERGVPGEAYNLCSGRGYKLKNLLDMLVSFSDKRMEVVQDPGKFRPLEDPIFVGDNSKIKKLGWKPRISIEQSLKDTLDYWRNQAR